VSLWKDKSGNSYDAKSPVGSPAYVSNGGPGNMPTIRILRSAGVSNKCSLSVDGSIFAKEHYYVFRSAAGSNKYDYYGGVLGHQSGRNSNYLFQQNQKYFHSNQYPLGGSQNGGAFSQTAWHANVNQFMVMRIVVNSNSAGAKSDYRIGTIDNNYCASIDVPKFSLSIPSFRLPIVKRSRATSPTSGESY
jgi:hypothetical protein